MANPSAASVTNALSDVPIKTMLTNMARAVADAQWDLDLHSIEVARQMATKTIKFYDKDGNPAEQNLIQLGLLPTFYSFSTANLELSVSLTVTKETEESRSIGVELGATFENTGAEGASGP